MIDFLRHVTYGLDFRFDRTRLALAAYAEEIRVSYPAISFSEPLYSICFSIIAGTSEVYLLKMFNKWDYFQQTIIRL